MIGSDVAQTKLFCKVIAGSVRERHDRVRRRFLRVSHKTGGIDNQQVLDFVATAPCVQHRGSRIIAHTATARFVRDASQRIRSYFPVRKDLSSGSAKNFFHLSVHFVANCEGVIIFGVRVESHLRNAEAILESIGIDFNRV